MYVLFTRILLSTNVLRVYIKNIGVLSIVFFYPVFIRSLRVYAYIVIQRSIVTREPKDAICLMLTISAINHHY